MAPAIAPLIDLVSVLTFLSVELPKWLLSPFVHFLEEQLGYLGAGVSIYFIAFLAILVTGETPLASTVVAFLAAQGILIDVKDWGFGSRSSLVDAVMLLGRRN